MISANFRFVKQKINAAAQAAAFYLALAEGLAVGALILGRIHFVSTHHDFIERAEVFVFCMMGTLLNGARNTAIGLLVFHKIILP